MCESRIRSRNGRRENQAERGDLIAHHDAVQRANAARGLIPRAAFVASQADITAPVLVRQVFRTSTDCGRSIRGGSINEAMLLEHATMSSSDCHVAGLVHEPESLPFIDDCTKVFRCVKQLLHTSLWTRGVDWQEASN